jgi:tetratricopeptide (TPR) repeat protein
MNSRVSWQPDPENPKPFCPDCDPVLFVMSSLGELDERERLELEDHCISCGHCTGLLFEITDIMKGVNRPSDKEFKLLLKFFATRLWASKEEQIIERVITKALEKIEQKNRHQETMDLIQSAPNALENSRKIDILDGRATNLENGQATIFKELKSIRIMVIIFSLSIISISILIFLILGLPAFQKQNPIAVSSSDHINSAKITNNSNLYEALDIAIDNYLSRELGIAEAEKIAKEIKAINNDNYGMDLVWYYNKLTKEKHFKLLQLRQKLKSLMETTVKEDPQHFLAKANELYQGFLLANDLIEAYRTKIILLKYYSITSDSKNIKYFTEELLTWTTDNNYLYLRLQTLLWQAKDPKEPNPISTLENVFNLAVKLNLFDVQVSSSTSLAAFYVNQQENQKALQLAETVLKAGNLKYTHKVTLLQIKGMAYFNLKDYGNSRHYLEQAVNISKENDDNFLITLSYSFYGTVLAQSGEYTESEIALNNAQDTVGRIKVPSHKAELESRVLGYQAKKEFLQGNYAKSANLYKRAIDCIEAAKLENNASMAELNQSLGIALKKIGSKKHIEHSRIASYYAKQTNLPKEAFSCVLSFIPRCS